MHASLRIWFFWALSLVLVITAGTAAGTETDDEILIVLCQIRGDNQETYQVTDILQQWLEVLYSDYANVTVERSDESFPFDESDYSWSSAQAQAVGIIRDADLVLFGAYMVEGTRVRIALVTQLTYRPFEDPVLGSAPHIFTREEAFDLSELAPTDTPPARFALNAYQWLAWVFDYYDEYEVCLSLLNDALEISDEASDADLVSILGDRSELYLVRFDEPELALSDVNAAIELNPDFMILHDLRDMILERIESGVAVVYPDDEDFPEGTCEYYYQKAVVLDIAGRFEEALDFYDAAIIECSDDEFLTHLYGDRSMCNTNFGNLDAARSDAEMSLQLDPTNAWAYARMAEIAEAEGDYAACVDYLTQGIAVDPDNHYLLGNRGSVYYHNGEMENARTDIINALQLYSANSNLHYILGAIYATEGSFEDAIESYSNAIEYEEMRGSISLYMTDRGGCYLELGYLDQARSDLDEAIIFDPNYSKAYHFRGVLNYLTEEDADAAWDFRKVLELSNNDLERQEAQMYLDEMGY